MIKNNNLFKYSFYISKYSYSTCYDIGIIGGGIVGLSTAFELCKLKPKPSIIILEKESQVGLHQSSNNSGVIHAGIYYTPGSDRARLCVKGLTKLYSFLNEYNLPYSKCGKLIVALNNNEIPLLNDLYKRALLNKCPNIKMITSSKEIKQIEPYCEGIAAIHSPETGITNFHNICLKLKDLLIENNVKILCNYHADNFIITKNKSTIFTNRYDKISSNNIECSYLISCAGSETDRIANQCGLSRYPSVVPIRGKWDIIKPEYGHLVKGNIYPVPNPKLPFLGVHFTKKIDSNEIWSGPNSIVALSREGYKYTDINIYDIWQMITHIGFYKLLKTHWKSGYLEVINELFFSIKLKKLQEYIPQLTKHHFKKETRSGVRTAVIEPSGEIVHDFLFITHPKQTQLHVRNAPSPAATSCFAIAEEIVQKAQKELSNFPFKKE